MKEIWISWENHRRSNELAHAMSIPIYVFQTNLPQPFKALFLSLLTFRQLILSRPERVYVQNPSMVLALMTALTKPIFGYILVVDRHSTFVIRTLKLNRIMKRIFYSVSRFTIRQADLTIVTNSNLADLVNTQGGHPFVLPDPVPVVSPDPTLTTLPPNSFLMISTYATDEPLDNVIETARLLGSTFQFFITGNATKCPEGIKNHLPENVHLTGFLPRSHYLSALKSATGIMALTTNPDTLVCGAYEALAVQTPFILSDHKALRDYFRFGCVFTDNSAKDLAKAIKTLIEFEKDLQMEIKIGVPELENSWQKMFAGLKVAMNQIAEQD